MNMALLSDRKSFLNCVFIGNRKWMVSAARLFFWSTSSLPEDSAMS
jgi:hypothetical protein